MKYTKMRGMRDIYGLRAKVLNNVETICQQVFTNFGFEKIYTPLLEQTALFARGIGDSSDIVRKEMYSFIDKGGREVALRPEATAGVIRAACENNLVFNNINKLFYNYTCYRYERQQEGRFREFRQFGGEIIGLNNVFAIIELLQIARAIFKKLQIDDIEVKINTLGNKEERQNYKVALLNFLHPLAEQLCSDCKKRIESNPLRVLDCKNDNCRHLLTSIPKIIDFVSEEEKNNLQLIKNFLKDDDQFKIIIDQYLVRGLDYYNGIVFEFISTNNKSINALGGGGGYNDLVHEIDLRYDVPGCGFSFGLDRIEEILIRKNILINNLKIFIAPLINEAQILAHQLQTTINDDCIVYVGVENNVKKHIKEALKIAANYIIFIGEDELKNNNLTIKNLEESTQEVIKQSDINAKIADIVDKNWKNK